MAMASDIEEDRNRKSINITQTTNDFKLSQSNGNGVHPALFRKSSIQRMLATIKAERNKEKTSEDRDYIVVHSSADAFWTSVFSKYFICKPTHEGDSDSRDDLLFFVRDTAAVAPKYGSSSNLLEQFEYTLTCAVCSRTGDRELQILKKCSQKVYASPSQRCMESKGTGESIAYPNIFFTVDNFDEVFSDIVIRDSEMVCVELVASDRHGEFQAVIFIGSIRYEALRNVFDSRQSTLSSKMRQSFSWGMQSQKMDSRRTEFIRMRGPQGKGYAEMAISRQKGVPDTPLSTPLTTPRATPLTTPVVSPRHSPDREELPPFPGCPDSSDVNDNSQQNSYNLEDRRSSETSASLPFKSSLKWSFGGIRKSQSATDNVSHMTNDAGEVEAKSISEELHQPGQGLFGRSFGQAWHWFKEQRRAASVGLNSCLTYVNLPWHRIIGDILDTRRAPVLSF